MDVSCAGARVYCIATFCNRICLATTYHIRFAKVMEGFPCQSPLPNEKRKWKNKKYTSLRITSARKCCSVS